MLWIEEDNNGILELLEHFLNKEDDILTKNCLLNLQDFLTLAKKDDIEKFVLNILDRYLDNQLFNKHILQNIFFLVSYEKVVINERLAKIFENETDNKQDQIVTENVLLLFLQLFHLKDIINT